MMDKQTRRHADRRAARTDQKIGILQDDLTEVKTELGGVSRKLGVAKRDRVLHTTDPGHQNRFDLIKLNQDPADFDDDEVPYQYTVCRTTVQSRTACLARKKREFPDSEVILELKGTPSAMALWRLYVEKRGHLIDRDRFYFYLRDGYTEEKLVKDLKAVHQARLTDAGLA